MTMAMSDLEGYAKHIGALRAEASLRRVTEIGIGSASMKQSQRDSILRDWNEEAGAKNRRRLSTPGEVAMLAAAAGFAVVRDIPAEKRN